MLNNSLLIDAIFFVDRKTDGIVEIGLVNTYPAFLGGVLPHENYDEDKFSGLELGLSWRKTFNNFSFDIGNNLFLLKTKTVKRDEFYEYDYLYRAGKSYYALFGLEAIGFFKDYADIESSPLQMFGPVQPGDIKYKDQNGDGFIDANDNIMIGDWASKVNGALTLKLQYKNFTLFTMANYRFGGNTIFYDSYYWPDGDVKYSEVALNRWTPSNSDKATFPRLSSQGSFNNFRESTFWLENNSLVSLSRMQLTYDLPETLATKLFTSNLSVYFMANNILNIAKNKDKMELNIGSEPQYRGYSFGVKALF